MEDLGLTSEEEAEYRDTFGMFDKDGSGTITIEELGTAMRALDQNPTEAFLKQIISEADCDRDGVVSFTEFAQMMQKKKQDGSRKEDLKDAFKCFDKNGDGYIAADELFSIMTKMGEPLTHGEAEEMIREADKDGNGLIDYNEFADLMNSSYKIV